MVDEDGVALDNAIKAQVAAKASVGDLAILENLDSNLNGICRGATGSHDCHGSLARTIQNQLIDDLSSWEDSLVTRLQMVPLILSTVKTSAGMDEDGKDFFSVARLGRLSGLEHRCGSGMEVIWVYGTASGVRCCRRYASTWQAKSGKRRQGVK